MVISFTIFVASAAIALCSLVAIELLKKLINSSRYQVFGELVDRVETSKKVVALTYDDGPNPPYTNQLLDILERYQAKATFFVVGQMMETHPELVRLILAKGNEIGNHSYSHQQLIFKSLRAIQSEIEKTDRLLRQFGVKQEIHFRAPYGRKLIILPYILAKMHKKNIMWTIDPKDYQASDSEVIEKYVLDRIHPGSIVLLHDGGGERSQTIAATEKLIKSLQAKGYAFKTISELIGDW